MSNIDAKRAEAAIRGVFGDRNPFDYHVDLLVRPDPLVHRVNASYACGCRLSLVAVCPPRSCPFHADVP